MVSKQDAPKSLFELKELEPEPESPFLDEAAFDLPAREEAWDSYEAEPEPQLETPFASALAEDEQLASTREEEFLGLPDTEEKESLITQHEQASPEELPFLDRELESLHDADEEEEVSFLEGKLEEEAEESEEQAAVSNSYFRIANDITSAFEGGKPDTLNLRDNGIISYGKHQATLSAGTLFFILKRYSELSQTDVSRRVTSYLDKVRRKDEGLRSDRTFLQLLKDAAREPQMSRAQDEVFATRYWNPAKTAAAQMGVRSALGHVLFYNTRVQGGLGSVLRRTTKQLGGKVGDVAAGRRITERQFLTAFVDQFISHRLANSARNTARARQLQEEAWALERQAAAAEPGVSKKLLREAHGKHRKAARNAVNAKALKRSATKTRGPSFKALVASGDLELRGGADGFVRLAGKPGVRIQGLRAPATVDEILSQLTEERSNDQLAADLALGFSAPQSPAATSPEGIAGETGALHDAGRVSSVDEFEDFVNEVLDGQAELEPDSAEVLGSTEEAESEEEDGYESKDDFEFERGEETGWEAEADKPGYRTPRDILDWKELIRFRVPVDIVKSIRNRGLRYFTVQAIESAHSDDVNLDYYPIYVSRMPTIDGTQLTAPQLLSRFRTNINSFLDTDLAEFSPASKLDARLWQSPNPRGSVLFIDIWGPDNAYVVCSDVTANYWRFSTVTEYRKVKVVSSPAMTRVMIAPSPPSSTTTTVQSDEHPVSGTREWGYVGTGQRAVFYTKGADRGSWRIERINRLSYAQGHKLWRSFQRKLVKFVNDHNGKAQLFIVGERGESFISGRHNWMNVEHRIAGTE